MLATLRFVPTVEIRLLKDFVFYSRRAIAECVCAWSFLLSICSRI